jgi:hypothetical protein
MTVLILIPPTLDEALTELSGLGELLTAREWKRAASVAAQVGPAPGPGRKSSNSATFPLGCRELVDKRIVGLGSQHTIERYRDAWCVDAGLPAPSLGERVELPDLPWPPSTHSRLDDGPRRQAIEEQARADGIGVGSALRVAESPEAMAAAIKADAKLAHIAREALASRPSPVGDHRLRRAGEDQEKSDAVINLEHLIDSERMDEIVARLVAQMRAGLMDRMPSDVRQEAVDSFRRWINALEWAVSIIEGGSITDESIARWIGNAAS